MARLDGRFHAVRVIATAGVLCGVLDGVSAVVVLRLFGRSAEQVFQGIARGVLGPAAHTGGPVAVAVGVVVHLAVAIGAAAAYYVFSRWVPAVNDHAIVAGIVFGA